QWLFQHEQFPEVIQGLYLYDPEVPKPSKGAIVFLGLIILASPKIIQELDDISSEISLTQGFALVAEKFRGFSKEELAAGAASASRQFFENSLNDADWEKSLLDAEWSIFVATFRDSKTWIERIICQQILERLVSLAVFEGHTTSIESLARVTQKVAFGEPRNSTTPQKIAQLVMSKEPILKRQLKWRPSKSAIKYFILALTPELTDNDTEWSKAWKIIGQAGLVDRSGPRLNQERKDELTSLARRIDSIS
ncbi:hypothetical protein N8580_03675, partial [Akkermansiaceae bacterium]|nr:hypothetical protein [Akkermansiaceae bacterium]